MSWLSPPNSGSPTRPYLLFGFCVLSTLLVLLGARHASVPSFSRFDLVSITCKANSASNSGHNRPPLYSKRLNVLHYIDKTTYDSIMDRWFARSHRDFAAAAGLVEHAALWGPDFPGYDTRLTLTENVETKYGRADYFDAILPYWNGDQTNWLGVDPVPMFFEIRELSQKGGTIVMDRPHEMRDDRRVPIIDRASH